MVVLICRTYPWIWLVVAELFMIGNTSGLQKTLNPNLSFFFCNCKKSSNENIRRRIIVSFNIFILTTIFFGVECQAYTFNPKVLRINALENHGKQKHTKLTVQTSRYSVFNELKSSNRAKWNDCQTSRLTLNLVSSTFDGTLPIAFLFPINEEVDWVRTESEKTVLNEPQKSIVGRQLPDELKNNLRPGLMELALNKLAKDHAEKQKKLNKEYEGKFVARQLTRIEQIEASMAQSSSLRDKANKLGLQTYKKTKNIDDDLKIHIYNRNAFIRGVVVGKKLYKLSANGRGNTKEPVPDKKVITSDKELIEADKEINNNEIKFINKGSNFLFIIEVEPSPLRLSL
jgi:hypothetical protein